MTEPTAVPVNLFENDRELMVVAPMPGIAPEDISIDVTDAGALTVRSAQRGEGQERIAYLLREWSYGPYERTVDLPGRRGGEEGLLLEDSPGLTPSRPM